MTGIFAIAALLAVTGADHPGFTSLAEPCRFALSPALTPTVVAAPEIRHRARVMTQSDSPLAIAGVNLSGWRLAGGPGFFEASGSVVIDVKNVSDAVLTSGEVMLRVAFTPESGAGSGGKLPGALAPGERARIQWTMAGGRGTHQAPAEPMVVALVTVVRTDGCTYKPSHLGDRGVEMSGSPSLRCRDGPDRPICGGGRDLDLPDSVPV